MASKQRFSYSSVSRVEGSPVFRTRRGVYSLIFSSRLFGEAVFGTPLVSNCLAFYLTPNAITELPAVTATYCFPFNE